MCGRHQRLKSCELRRIESLVSDVAEWDSEVGTGDGRHGGGNVLGGCPKREQRSVEDYADKSSAADSFGHSNRWLPTIVPRTDSLDLVQRRVASPDYSDWTLRYGRSVESGQVSSISQRLQGLDDGRKCR
jgi:hypothetical protein